MCVGGGGGVGGWMGGGGEKQHIAHNRIQLQPAPHPQAPPPPPPSPPPPPTPTTHTPPHPRGQQEGADDRLDRVLQHIQVVAHQGLPAERQVGAAAQLQVGVLLRQRAQRGLGGVQRLRPRGGLGRGGMGGGEGGEVKAFTGRQ